MFYETRTELNDNLQLFFRLEEIRTELPASLSALQLHALLPRDAFVRVHICHYGIVTIPQDMHSSFLGEKITKANQGFMSEAAVHDLLVGPKLQGQIQSCSTVRLGSKYLDYHCALPLLMCLSGLIPCVRRLWELSVAPIWFGYRSPSYRSVETLSGA
jgi:hypothetical protein